jgi:hypothetical protein
MMISSELDRSELLTVADLLKRWEGSLYPVSPVTLARWRRDRRGPEYVKIGASGRIFYLLDSVIEYETTNNIVLATNV